MDGENISMNDIEPLFERIQALEERINNIEICFKRCKELEIHITEAFNASKASNQEKVFVMMRMLKEIALEQENPAGYLEQIWKRSTDN